MADQGESTAQDASAATRATVFLLAAIFFLGLFQILALPPWEGFDETAHWSSIQAIADLGRPPIYGDPLSADRLSYFGPEPRGIDARGRSYQSLRDRPPASLAGGPQRYRPETGRLNWQAQHPPLYYALMAPVYRAAHGLAWVDHLLVLRLVSWLMAIGGLTLGVFAVRRVEAAPHAGLSPWTTPLSLLWPLLFAGFFADQARLGNDSLCLLLFGALWLVLLPMLVEREGPARGRPVSAVLIGLILGAGLWTKAFFGPISLGVGALLAVRAWRSRDRVQAIDVAIAVGLAWAIGAAWYLMKLRTTGALTGADEAIRLARSGGLLHGLAEHPNPVEFARGLAVVLSTIGWAGTWSLARLPEIAMAPGVILLVWLCGSYLARLRGERRLISWAPLAMAAPMLAGLVYHILIRIALDGAGGTPGWYLHVIAPALGLVLALGWTRPRAFAVLGALAVAFTLASWTSQLSLFSGCVGVDAGKHYDFAHAACGIDWIALGRIAHPGWALAALTLGLVSAAAAAWCARAAWTPLLRPAEPSEIEALTPLL